MKTILSRSHSMLPSCWAAVKSSSAPVLFSLPSFIADTPDIPVSLLSVQGLVASFRLPQLPEGQLLLLVPAGAVKSAESGVANEEFRLTRPDAWKVIGGSLDSMH